MLAVQHRRKLFGVHLAGQVQASRPVAQPSSRGFARTEVLVLDARGDRPQVVLLLAGGQLADAQHHQHRRT
jgi:hypothetical protein